MKMTNYTTSFEGLGAKGALSIHYKATINRRTNAVAKMFIVMPRYFYRHLPLGRCRMPFHLIYQHDAL